MSLENEVENSDRVLFVDDEAFILFSLRRYFRQHGIIVEVETDCIKATQLIKENKYKVIISDFRMPNMNGAEFLGIVKEISPESIRIMLSAQVNQENISDVINKGEVYRFVNKPWNDNQLLETIKDAINKFDNNFQKIEPVSNDQIIRSELKKEELPPDLYLEDILPKLEVDTNDFKKLSETSRNEMHQHLNYILNLTSSKIGMHCKRVAQLSLHFAKKLKLENNELKDIYLAGLYHDIGKIFELVTQTDHCELGANLLLQFNELKGAALIVRGHHKRLDDPNSGEIPKACKILSIVDYFDKQVTKEIDKELDEKPRTLVDIISEMEAEVNKRFDSELMKEFKKMILEEFKLDSFFSEERIHISEMREGMVLSRPLLNIQGKMLLNSEYILSKDVIERLFKHNTAIPMAKVIYIYKKAPEKAFNYEEQVSKKVSKEVIN